MERINKATLLREIRPEAKRKCGDFPQNRLRLGVDVLFLEYTFVCQMKKGHSLAYFSTFFLFRNLSKLMFFYFIRN